MWERVKSIPFNPDSASYKDFDHSQRWESIEKKILCIENLLNKIFFLWESIQKNILSGENPLRKKFSALRICWIKFSPSENLFTKYSQWWESIKKILCIENLLNKIFFFWESIKKNILSGENPLRKKFSALRICWIKFSPSENLFKKYSLWWESIKKKILCIENLLNKIFSLWEPIQKIFSVVRIL